MKVIRFIFFVGIGFILSVVGQNCSNQNSFILSTIQIDTSKSNSSGNGQGYDGKLTFLHLSPNFTCENKSAPESVLRRDELGQWTLTLNKVNQCAYLDRQPVKDVVYSGDQFYFTYNQLEYYRDNAAPWDNSSLTGYLREYIVSSKVDANTPDQLPGDGVCADSTGNCSLRAAIDEVNAQPNKATLVQLNSGTYQLTSVQQIKNKALLVLLGNNNSTTIIDGAFQSELIEIGDGVSALNSSTVISDLSLTRGSTLNIFRGSAITLHENLRLLNSSIINNSLAGADYFTVRISNYVTPPQLSLDATSVNNNSGPGIATFGGGQLSVDRSDISGNQGWGIWATMGIMKFNIRKTSFSNNAGSGILLQDCQGQCLVENSTFFKNTLGGLVLQQTNTLNSSSSDILIKNSTFFQNGTTNNANLYLDMNNVGPLRKLKIYNSIFSHDSANANAKNCDLALLNNFQIETVNSLATDTSCGTNGFIIGDPMLSPTPSIVANNLGLVLIPQPSSPAIDGGDNGTCSDQDQLGIIRPVAKISSIPRCDIGSVEVQ